jgi:hypothetical protein
MGQPFSSVVNGGKVVIVAAGTVTFFIVAFLVNIHMHL